MLDNMFQVSFLGRYLDRDRALLFVEQVLSSSDGAGSSNGVDSKFVIRVACP